MSEKEALKILNSHTSFSKILSHYETKDFHEFIVNRYGDVVNYRVYNSGQVVIK